MHGALKQSVEFCLPRRENCRMIAPMTIHWDFALILLFLGVLAPWLGYRRVRRLMLIPATTSMERLALYGSTIAVQWVATAVILWRVIAHGSRPAELGFSVGDEKLTISIAVVLTFLLLANQIASIRRLAARPSEIKGMIAELSLKIFPQDSVERLAFVALVCTVAICEELIYRGFVQALFQGWTGGSITAGIVLSALFFAVAHVYQGRRGLISTFIIGILFAGVRAGTGSLIPSICAHFAADLVAGLLAPVKLGPALRARLQQSESSA
jgi:membrane protease YdiL (CAAX protease family)